MTKIIAAILAVLMLVTCFAACGEKKPPETTPNNNSGIPNPDDKDPATDPNNKPDNPSDTDPNNKPDTPDEIVFDDVDETVYVTADTLTIRTSAEVSETNIKGYVNKDTELKRTGYHKDWSRVEWEGEVVYCATKYLSTVNPNPEIPFDFTDVNETVYVDTTPNAQPDGTIPAYANIYLFPITDVEEYYAGSIAFGTELTRSGIYYVPAEEDPKNEGLGWSRIEIDGETYYIRNSNVSITKPNGAEGGAGEETPDTNETPDNNTEA